MKQAQKTFSDLTNCDEILAQAGGVPVGRFSVSQYFPFHFFLSPIFSVATFSHRRSARIKKLI